MKLQRIEELTNAWFDGQLTLPEKDELERALLASAAARQSFLSVAKTHALLCLQGEIAQPLDLPRAARRSAHQRRVRTRWSASMRAMAACIAIAFLLMLGLAAFKPMFRRELPAAITLTDSLDVKDLLLPARLPGTVHLAEGCAWLQLPSGVKLALLGPATLEVHHELETHLAMGGLVAEVPPQATGFKIDTPHAQVRDLGTVFSVNVTPETTECFVLKGAVQVNTTDGLPAQDYVAGQGVRVGELTHQPLCVPDGTEESALASLLHSERAMAEPARALALISNTPCQPRGTASTVPEDRETTIAAQPQQETEEVEVKLTDKPLAALVAATIAGAAQATPQVSNVTLSQQGAYTRNAVVSYQTDAPGIATFQFMTNGVSIAPSGEVATVSGQINQYLPAGDYSFAWNAGRDLPELVFSNLTVEVKLWSPESPPLYCAVYLVPDQSGKFPMSWYGAESEVPHGVSDDIWKKERMLLRKIPATTVPVTLGSPSTEDDRSANEGQRVVHITQPFYMGIYQVTQYQWSQIKDDAPSSFKLESDRETRPAEQVSYYRIRENEGNSINSDYTWPQELHAVHPNSFMGILRTKSGDVLEFDLPTEAQWEYACRAGTTGRWNYGTDLTVLARYKGNGGDVPKNYSENNVPASLGGTAKVGSYLPNAWGLYDMHGNVFEWCLDWITNIAPGEMGGDDPVGPESSPTGKRVVRGGGWSHAGTYARSAFRGNGDPDAIVSRYGLRVVAPAVILVPPAE